MQWLINYGLSSEKMVGNSRVLGSWGFELSMCKVKDGHLAAGSVNARVSEGCTEVGRLGVWEVSGHGAVSAVEALQVLEQVGLFPEQMAF